LGCDIGLFRQCRNYIVVARRQDNAWRNPQTHHLYWIMQFSPHSSAIPIPLVFCGISFIQKIERVPTERGHQTRMGWGTKATSYTFMPTRYVQSWVLMTNRKLHYALSIGTKVDDLGWPWTGKQPIF